MICFVESVEMNLKNIGGRKAVTARLQGRKISFLFFIVKNVTITTVKERMFMAENIFTELANGII